MIKSTVGIHLRLLKAGNQVPSIEIVENITCCSEYGTIFRMNIISMVFLILIKCDFLTEEQANDREDPDNFVNEIHKFLNELWSVIMDPKIPRR